MSLDLSGAYATGESQRVNVKITSDHPLLRLAALLPWDLLMRLVVEDLKLTTKKGYWWLGRRLIVRLHLSAYLLQKLYDLTDRQVEYGLKDNAAYQLFSGKNIIQDWHSPDHTKIENFRNRLSPETQRVLANELTKVAVDLGFADPREVDIDSTVQEANISYPSDATLMTKLAGLGKKVLDYLKVSTKGILPKAMNLEIKAIKSKAQEYFFLPKNTVLEKRKKVFADLHAKIKKQMYPVIEVISKLDVAKVCQTPWNIRVAIEQIQTDARRYLLDVAHFIRTNKMKTGKILSFHSKAIACVIKGKAGKEKEFGRVFQLGRIKGNFLFVLKSNSVRMHDKNSLIPMLEEHTQIFGDSILESLATDKGYWSRENYQAAKNRGIKEIGIQFPGNIKNPEILSDTEIQATLKDRRAGIEPLILLPPHVGKHDCKQGGQLGQSRMKSDRATLAAGYGSVLGLNLRQLIRHQGAKLKMVV